MSYDRDLINAVVNMESKIGAFSVYGMHEFITILQAGCDKMGYSLITAEESTVHKLKNGNEHWTSILHATVSVKERN
jgi:hypothetical protein